MEIILAFSEVNMAAIFRQVHFRFSNFQLGVGVKKSFFSAIISHRNSETMQYATAACVLLVGTYESYSVCVENWTSTMDTGLDWIVQCFMSPPTQYRLYGRRFLQVKRPNQQYQSTEGTNSTQRNQTYNKQT